MLVLCRHAKGWHGRSAGKEVKAQVASVEVSAGVARKGRLVIRKGRLVTQENPICESMEVARLSPLYRQCECFVPLTFAAFRALRSILVRVNVVTQDGFLC